VQPRFGSAPPECPFRDGAGEQQVHRGLDALAGARRPRDRQRPLAAAELSVEDQERQAAEVIPVQVGQHRAPDLIGLDSRGLERQKHV